MNELLYIVEDCPTFLHSIDNRGEIIVHQDHVGSILGDIGPCDTHCDADVGHFDCRRIVNAVARHCDNLPMSAQGGNNSQFVFRSDACIDANLVNADSIIRRLKDYRDRFH